MAYEPSLSKGDFIEVDFDRGAANKRMLYGKVLAIYKRGPVPDIDEHIVGTPEDPAVQLQIYTEEYGKWRPTKSIAAFRMSELQRTLVSSRGHIPEG